MKYLKTAVTRFFKHKAIGLSLGLSINRYVLVFKIGNDKNLKLVLM